MFMNVFVLCLFVYVWRFLVICKEVERRHDDMVYVCFAFLQMSKYVILILYSMFLERSEFQINSNCPDNADLSIVCTISFHPIATIFLLLAIKINR